MNNKILLNKIVFISVLIVFSFALIINQAQAETNTFDLDVVYPQSGDTFVKGTTVTIEWRTYFDGRRIILHSDIPVVDFYISYDGVRHLVEEDIPNISRYDWFVEWEGSGEVELVFGADAYGEYTYYTSETFSIVENTFTIDVLTPSPERDESLFYRMGRTNALFRWDYINSATYKVDVDLYKNGEFIVNLTSDEIVAEDDGITGTYDWQASVRVTIPENIEVGRDYSVRVTDANNPDIYGQGGNFFIIDDSDNTPPSDLINISVSKKSPTDPDYKIKFEYTTPPEIDYYCVDVYRRNVTGPVTHEQVLECVDKGVEPSTDSSYSSYEDSYVKEHSSGLLYYFFGTRDIAGNLTRDGNLYPYSWGDIETTPFVFTSPSSGENWPKGSKQKLSWTYKDTWYYITIDLYKDGVFIERLIDYSPYGVPREGNFNTSLGNLLFPYDLEEGPGYTIKAIDLLDDSIIGESNEFSIIDNEKVGAECFSDEIYDGDLVHNPDAEGLAAFDIYIVKIVNNKKFKRLILNPNVLNSYEHINWDCLKKADSSVMSQYVTSNLVRAQGNDKVYKLFSSEGSDTGVKQWLNISTAVFDAQYDSDSIYEINATDRDAYTIGADLE